MPSFPAAYILTGMHRSGTSLMGRFLHRAGIALGPTLLAADASNPHGYFEDTEILAFHRRVLWRQYRDERLWHPRTPQYTAEDRGVAHDLVTQRRQAGQPWGWKEPRTCLFLDLWASLIPEALFLFVFRHPFAVLESLAKWHQVAPTNWRKHNNYVRAWLSYNRHILRFYQQQPARCVLFAVEQAVAQPERFVVLLTQRMAYPLRAEDFLAAYDSRVLSPRPPLSRTLSPFLRVSAWQLHRTLLRVSDLAPARA